MNEWRFPLVASPMPVEKQQGHVVWDDPVLIGWDWPYVAVRGAKPGPTLLVMTRMHGSEHSSIDAAMRLAAGIDAGQIKEQLLVLPLLNPAAFWQRTAYVCQVDSLNPNRVFPGQPLGSFTERLAWHITELRMGPFPAGRFFKAMRDGGSHPSWPGPPVHHHAGNIRLDEGLHVPGDGHHSIDQDQVTASEPAVHQRHRYPTTYACRSRPGSPAREPRASITIQTAMVW